MRRINFVLALALGMILIFVFPEVESHGAMVSDGFSIPKQGFVPNSDVAQSIAEAVASAVYGKETIASERPFEVTLKRDVWIIKGSVPCYNAPPGARCPGGAFEVRISREPAKFFT